MRTILCYGDSNTWGFVPGSLTLETFHMERFPRNLRWTGILQELLGSEYYVVEEGLNGRTTNVRDEDIFDRNGKTFLPTCLYAHSPIDLVVLMLGTNDLKTELNRTSSEIVEGINELIQIIQNSSFGPNMKSSPQILLISPPLIRHEDSFDGAFIGARKRSQGLSLELEQLAKEKKCLFLDAAKHISYCDLDGVHLDEKNHKMLAHILYEQIDSHA